MNTGWQTHADASTLGEMGPQGGPITRDESHPSGARLIYEEDAARSFHAVTCVIPNWLVHPRFFDSTALALQAMDEMRPALEALVAKLPNPRPPPGDPQTFAAGAALAAFMTQFP